MSNFSQYGPRVLSRPPEPWVVYFENLFSEEETELC